MIAGFHHVALIVSDLAAARRFYLEALGGEEIAAHYRAPRDSWKVDVKLPDGGQLELFTFPAAPPRPSRPEARGLRHLAFRVADLDAMVARMAAFGVACEPIRVDEYTGARFTFCADPDGLPIEFYETR
ncbi:SMU1112c/YaeR family gloxylase I-like metalloprotein [Chitinimonas koreensis]|uniref:SMU1112c/YaeR family gloxylase I-like metalloprotein n=1 Tax=Chitinimonas koreensis TaxID=356302 RepID=UPI00040F76AD|nr:VOC family protein [Chitinimonas koreensis]QNM96445.1 VOC family protein [Chitinimonas koreensis]